MKKNIIIGLLLILVLSGGDKEVEKPKEEKKYICKEITQLITMYDNNQISFNNFRSDVSDKYNEICSKDNSEECEYIANNLINNTSEMLNDLVGCDIYKDQDAIDKCVQSGESFDYLKPIIASSQRTVVDDIKVKCGLMKNDTSE